MIDRVFFYPGFRRYVLLTGPVLRYLYAYVQYHPLQTEAGGEVYASDPMAPGLVVAAAAGPYPTDSRGRCRFNPDTEATTRERERQYLQGRHAVGLWHTHPEQSPSLSDQDYRTTRKYLDAFQGDRDRYFNVILGNVGFPPNLAVWAASRDHCTRLIEARAGAAGS